MNITKYNFPEVTITNMAFETFDTIPELLEEAKVRGFYNGNSKYNQLFSSIFFNGGKLTFKSDIDKKFKSRALPYLKSLIESFTPSHEDKEAVCALLLSEMVEC